MVSGAAIVAQRLAEALSHKGHDVLVLAASDTGREIITTHPNFRLRRLVSLPNPFRVGQRFVLSPKKSILAEINAFQPNIVHAHDPLRMGMIGIRAARSKGISTVITAHALPWIIAAYFPNLPGLRRSVEELGWAYARRISRQCTRLVVPTRPVAEILCAHGITLPEVVSNGIDPLFTPIKTSPDESLVLRQKYGLDPDLPVILYVGRIDADKQVEHVAQAAACLLQAAKAQFLVVGDGTRRHAVMELCKASGIRGKMVFPGFVPMTGDLPGLYRLACGFVTAGELETQCLTVLEAFSSGLPVVTVKTEVMAEIVQDGVNGFLVPPGDINALGDRLLRLLQNPDRAREMGRIGQTTAQRYSEQQMVQRYEDLYQRLQ